MLDGSHLLDEFFSCTEIPDIKCSKNSESMPFFIHCSDLRGFVTYILKARSFHFIDGGGGSLKICLTILPINEPESEEKTEFSGIKKSFIIGLGPNFVESYENMKIMLTELNLHTLCGVCPYSFAADFKLIMILLGLQSNASAHPCSWCNVSSKDLRGNCRTIQSISENFRKWKNESKGDLSQVKNYENCIGFPFLVGGSEKPVLSYIPPPELHILLGVVQKLYEILQKEYPEVASEWMKKLCIGFDHFGKFNGDSARKILKNVSILETDISW